MYIHHHTGGLEIAQLLVLMWVVIHHHTGGLENQSNFYKHL
ncbi:hypothetical protein [uncultured Gammaproteobacteria bacterium]|nr:hypothetical protein [uncultured Gammaproteobacteria bacterium]